MVQLNITAMWYLLFLVMSLVLAYVVFDIFFFKIDPVHLSSCYLANNGWVQTETIDDLPADEGVYYFTKVSRKKLFIVKVVIVEAPAPLFYMRDPNRVWKRMYSVEHLKAILKN